ncbi:MAG: AMP-dependent synthetase, partial [Mesorhizobium sp.]|uniref:AMP-binding protein n=1 Tax=Mesorhizobium sp. TaxID=1871066 RepID=UPI000FE9423C
MTNTADTVDLAHRLAPGAADAPAVSAPDRPTLTHGGLRRLIALGLGRGDRVAIVLPNGPEMATAFLAVAAAASTAPLNPAYRADELDFYLSDIGARAILVARDEQGPAVEVAERLGIRVLRLLPPDDAAAGSFAIEGDPVGPPVAS